MIKFLDLQKVNARYADELHEATRRVINRGWYLQGEECERFETDYAHYIGTHHCVSCASGLDALILMLRAYLELGKLQTGDEVIVPANTYIATILAITENGLTPILIEPRLDKFQIDDSLIEPAITERTRVILLVHLYGRCSYTEKIGEIVKRHNLLLLEDNAQAHGCQYLSLANTPHSSLSEPSAKASSSRQEHKNALSYGCEDLTPHLLRTGSLGSAAAHSFYPGKNLGALGDGGAVTTNDTDLAEVIRALANYGSQKKYIFKYKGRNSRLDELQAAILSVKLQHLDKDNSRRQQIAAYYQENIRVSNGPFSLMRDDKVSVFHIFPLLSLHRDKLQSYLGGKGIQTLIHYPIPPHKQECYREWNQRRYPLTEQICNQELSLPMSPVLTDVEVETIVDIINQFQS